ncbi:glycosyl hydrolase family 65 protein [Fodinicurvata sp. EGI_FJ10296]|uniref:glycoside hydrolase family 65 protein n=1 Tax=Fodinicurvata sp. EGI_FJ10296 TaxID=3231908 RepID=UPI003456E5B4
MVEDTNAWVVVYEGFDAGKEGLREALCTLGNGYFATRGAAADACDDEVHYPGTYLASGYNRLESEVSGRTIRNEDLVNMPNWLPLTFRIEDGPWFRLNQVELLHYRQELDLRHGQLRRDIRFRDGEGRITRWEERRIVGMSNPHLAGLEVSITPENWSGVVTFRSEIDGSVINNGVARYRQLASRHIDILELDYPGSQSMFLQCRTNQSRIQVAMAARTRLLGRDGVTDARCENGKSETKVWQDLTCTADQGVRITAEKILALHDSRNCAIAEAGLEAKRTLSHARDFESLREAHEIAWCHLWDDCDIELADGVAADTELKLRLHIFHILQTASPHSIDLDAGIPARGWHGEAYRGHIFWDEIFVFPFLSLRLPTLARALLRYRYRRLPEARRAAKVEGYEGAMFPWQSGSNGEEETQHLHLNPQSGRWLPDDTHRQRHINAAIAFNIWQYHQATDDHEFLYTFGAEMFFEIARFWVSMTTYNPEIDRYEIKGVMGPDEYHTAYPDADHEEGGGLDNNAYTNVMVSWILTRVEDIIAVLPRSQAERICERIGLHRDDMDKWHEISRKLRVPFHADGVISQFEGYEKLKEFDWDGYREKYDDIHRLDRLLEAEGDDVNRYKASKQADVLMLFYLFSADELYLIFERLGYRFPPSNIRKTIDYYLARTSHGSTLSGVAHSWVLARSDRSHSWRLFQWALDSDYSDLQGGTTPEGIHVGAMAGTIDLVQRCYVGLEMRGNTLHFDPALPEDLHRIKVRLRYRRQVLEVDVDHDKLHIASRSFSSTAIRIAYRGHYRDLAAGETCDFRLIKPEERNRDENCADGDCSDAPVQ